MTTDLNELQEIERLAEEKERQWHSAATLQIKTLQKELVLKSRIAEEMELKFSQLKTDFKYNLKLLKERDMELQSMDEIQRALKVNESKYLSELSDLHITIDNLKAKLNHDLEGRKEMELHHKKRMVDLQTQFEIFRTSKTKEMEELISDFQKSKLKLEQENGQLKFQVEAQKLDLVNEMEILLKSKEKEQQTLKEENHNQCVCLEMKNKLLSKEIEVSRNKEEQHQAALAATKKKIDALQGELQKAKWNLADISSMKNSRILELEAKVKQLETSTESIEKEFSERRMQLDKEIRRRESNLIASKQTLIDRENRFQDEIRSLESKVEMSKAEVNRALWDKNNVQAALEDEIKRCKLELADLREKLENEEIEKNRCSVAKDSEVALLKKRDDLLKAENKKLKSEIEKYKSDLVKSAKREEALERNMQQVKLDCRRKYEDAESDAYVKAEDFANNLVRSRDSAVAEKERIRAEVEESRLVCAETSRRLKAAMSILKQHKLISDYELNLESDNFSVSSSTLQSDLLEQNHQLKAVIKQMTSEMEQLHSLKHKTPESSDSKYVESIEKELIELKNERRRMREKLETLQGPAKELSSNSFEISEKHPKIQEHINALNKKIGNLEAEKVDMRAQLQKLQAKFDHQLMVSQQYEQESNALSAKLQQAELESTGNKHRSEQEIKRLKHEISYLTLQLSESRREADEYYRGGIQNNLRAVELSDKVSQLTVGMAADSPWLSNHIQAKVMQDLQDKVSHLQKQLVREKQTKLLDVSSSPGGSDSVKLLRLKLRTAGDRIRALIQEKNMLLESSYKLRAELSTLTQQQVLNSDFSPSSPSKTFPTEGKLEKMEKLQYDLTKKQLAFAKRHVQTSDDSHRSSPEVLDKDPPETHTHDVVRALTSSPAAVLTSSNPVMMSSIDDASIRDVWKVLEQEPSSPSIASEQVNLKQPKVIKAKSSTALPRRKKKPKIRNYNIKEDQRS